MKYEYMKEYPCNGEKPDLPDDVLVLYYNPVSMFNSKGVVVSLNWSHISKFKVIDERCKPEHHIPDAGKKIKSDWFERRELPPVGSEWIHKNGNCYTVTGYANEKTTTDKYPVTVIYEGGNGNTWCRPLSDWHRSMKCAAGRDELIPKVATAIYKGRASGRTSEDIAIALYDAGMLNKPG